MSYRHLPILLLGATLYSVNIIVVQALKTPHLLHAIYATIFGRLWFIWFWLGKIVWCQIWSRKLSSKPKAPKIWWKQYRKKRQYNGKTLTGCYIADYLPPVKKQDMLMHFWSMIDVNKIADVSIDFGLNQGLSGWYYRKNPSVDKK